ncbi:Glyoxylate reductase [Candidatus Hydrogenisulfobacillus filiaventi]|uniref:Glyoxylate reductase n=1 Tax=Candidatus Hydrogenisulfobacillus filiaventi TaxID=2707344 RepID=A0A6F8ZEM1_9FIRM|nr:Glyoxylate reductase [Candidatus Hydrogenisulfobacillus filiaventi]
MRVLICHRIAPTVVEAIRQAGHEVVQWTGPGPIPPGRLAAELRQADAALTMLTDRIDGRMLEGAERLRVVANVAVGFDNLDLAALAAHGGAATNTPDVLTEATAELALALLLLVMRDLPASMDALRGGRWQGWEPDAFLGRELAGKTLGIVGYGRIGAAVARRAAAFGMHILAAGPHPRTLAEGRWAPLEELLAASDAVSVHTPLTPATYHLFNRDTFARMRPGSYFVNTARGAVVDTGALLEALDSGRLAGAALDVFEVEPLPPGHPLLAHPRVVLTPHVGSATVETRTRMAERAWRNVEAVFRGEAPPDWLNPPERFPA